MKHFLKDKNNLTFKSVISDDEKLDFFKEFIYLKMQ